MEKIGTTRDGLIVLAHAYRTGYGLVYGLRADMFPGERTLLGAHYAAFPDVGCIDAPSAMPAGALRGADQWINIREAAQITAVRGGFA